MWNLLWLLPLIFLVWAVVLVIRKVKKDAAREAAGESKPATLAERLAALDADAADERVAEPDSRGADANSGLDDRATH